MSIEYLYNELRENNVKDRTRNDLLANLYKIPRRERGDDMPKFQTLMPNTIHQSDLVFLPHDHGYKYLLVVVDACDRKMDAVPLREKYSDVVKRAFEVIYNDHKILKLPKIMQFDAGSEFHGECEAWFHERDVDTRYAPTARHRMQGLVERLNQTIGDLLMKRMAAEELLTHLPSRKWVSDVPELIRVLNEHRPVIDFQPKKDEKPIEKVEEPVYTKASSNIIPIGTPVRATLDYPIDVATGKRVHGTFRSADIKWGVEPRLVKEVLLRPSLPPMYLLDGDIGKQHTDGIARTFQQLQVIKPDEKKPSSKYIRKESKKEAVVDEPVVRRSERLKVKV